MKFYVTDYGKYKMIHIEGNLLINKSYGEINETIKKLINEGNHHFIFNLEKLSTIDSSGMSVFIHCLCDVQESNGSLLLIIPDDSVRNVIELVGLNRLIKTFLTLDEFEKAKIK